MNLFEKELSRTWMSKGSHVEELDRLVSGRLVSTLHAQGRRTPPHDLARWAIQRVHAAGRYELFAIGRWPQQGHR